MGQEHPKLSNSVFTRTPQQIHHPLLNTPATLTVLTSSSSPPQKRIQYTIKVHQRQTCKKWQSLLKNYFSKIDTSLFYLPIRYHYKATQYCSNAGIITIEYEYLPRTLAKEVRERAEVNRRFGEGQIWMLLYVLAKGASLLYGVGRKLGKIGFQTVFINVQTQDIRIANGLTFFSDIIMDQIISPQQLTSPTLLHSLPQTILSESFSIGILLACLCLLLPFPPSTIRQSVSPELQLSKIKQLQSQLQQLQPQQLYSKQLTNVILQLITIQAKERLSIQRVVEGLQKNVQFMVYVRSIMTGVVVDATNRYQQLDQYMEKWFMNRAIGGQQAESYSGRQASFILDQYGNSRYTTPRTDLNNIQKVISQYIPYKKSQQQLNDPYTDFFAMVDSQLQKSRRSFPS